MTRLIIGDGHPTRWTEGREETLQKHLQRAVRPGAPEAKYKMTQTGDVTSPVSRLKAEGASGPEELAYPVRMLSREMSSSTANTVLRESITFRAADGILFADFFRDYCILVGSVRCLGTEVTPDRAQVQSVTKTAIRETDSQGLEAIFSWVAMIARRRLTPWSR